MIKYILIYWAVAIVFTAISSIRSWRKFLKSEQEGSLVKMVLPSIKKIPTIKKLLRNPYIWLIMGIMILIIVGLYFPIDIITKIGKLFKKKKPAQEQPISEEQEDGGEVPCLDDIWNVAPEIAPIKAGGDIDPIFANQTDDKIDYGSVRLIITNTTNEPQRVRLLNARELYDDENKYQWPEGVTLELFDDGTKYNIPSAWVNSLNPDEWISIKSLLYHRGDLNKDIRYGDIRDGLQVSSVFNIKDHAQNDSEVLDENGNPPSFHFDGFLLTRNSFIELAINVSEVVEIELIKNN